MSRYTSFSLFFDRSFTLGLIGLLLMFHRFLPMYHLLIPSHRYCASHARTMSLFRFSYLLRFACIDHSFLFLDFVSHYCTKSGCIWLFVSLYFTQYINLVDTAIQLQTCSGHFPSLLSALSLALVIVTERLRALRLLTLEQVSLSSSFLWTLLAHHSNCASTAPHPFVAPRPYRHLYTFRHTLVLWYASFCFVSLCRTSRRFSPMASISTR